MKNPYVLFYRHILVSCKLIFVESLIFNFSVLRPEISLCFSDSGKGRSTRRLLSLSSIYSSFYLCCFKALEQQLKRFEYCLCENDASIRSLCALSFYNCNEINCPYAVGWITLFFLQTHTHALCLYFLICPVMDVLKL